MRGFALSYHFSWSDKLKRGSRMGSVIVSATVALTVACQRNLSLPGEAQERERAAQAALPYKISPADRVLPDLERDADLGRVLETAFNSNGEIEAAYREWRAALERVPQAGALADPRLDFSVLFGPDSLKSFGDFLRVMASQEIPAKGKRAAQARKALKEAQAAGERFRAAKFKLQNRIVQAYARAALNESYLDLSTESLQLLHTSFEVMTLHFHTITGEAKVELNKIEVEIEKLDSDRRAFLISRESLRAELNGLLNREPNEPLGVIRMPSIRAPETEEAKLLARAVENNPELAALRKEIEARGAEQTLAELAKKPDFMFGGGMDDPLMPILSAGITLPINKQRIRSGIEEALAMRQAAEARLRNASRDAQSRLIMALLGIRDAERVLDDYNRRVIPKVRETLDLQLRYYGSGGGSFMELIDTQRLMLDFQKMVRQAEADRLRNLSDLEEILGEDLFDFAPQTQTPAEAKP